MNIPKEKKSRKANVLFILVNEKTRPPMYTTYIHAHTDLHRLSHIHKQNDLIMIAGDFNAKLGEKMLFDRHMG